MHGLDEHRDVFEALIGFSTAKADLGATIGYYLKYP
jgi:hypothetical protein